jgi:hypothetical protein
MDFTLKIYKQLLSELQKAAYEFITFEEYSEGKRPDRFVILRHDVDLRAGNSVATAKIENSLNVRASYYFRVVPQSNQPNKIKEIVALNHEIGYHYEDMSLFGGDHVKSIKHFEEQLKHFRQFYPVRTICMHGSPTSKYDNRDLWKNNNYRDFGIIGEPYFDIDFNQVFYLTDTGRCWDGDKYSVRDKVASNFQQCYHSTQDIINAAKTGSLPPQIMITTHPQRWTDNKLDWLLEFFMQNIKNFVKRILISL